MGRLAQLGTLVKAAHGLWILAGWLVLEAAGVPAVGEEVPATGAPDPEVQAVLSRLDDAGAPLTSEEARDLTDPGPDPGSWVLRLRHRWREECLGPATVKLDLQHRGWRVRLRRGSDGCDALPVQGALTLAGESLTLMAGNVSLAHGFGLVSGKPGRSSTAAADRTLLAPGAGLRDWPYTPSGGAIQGGGAEVRAGAWSATWATGTAPGVGTSPGMRHTLIRLRRGGGRADPEVSVLVDRAGTGGAAAVFGRWMRDSWRVEFEAAAPGLGDAPQAVCGVIRFTASRRLRLEGGGAWSGAGPPGELSVRPAFLGRWRGRGWALRGVVKPRPGSTLMVLLSGTAGEGEEFAGREYAAVTDVIGYVNPGPNLRVNLRWRRKSRRRLERSPEWPWLPPEAGAPEMTTLLQIGLRVRLDSGWVQGVLRSRTDACEDGGGTRLLWSLRGERDLGREWLLRWGKDTAWGDPVDLVSASSPLRGYIVPRHWARWREQWLLGLERELGVWRVQAGTAGRVPVPPATRIAWEGWVELLIRW